MAAASVYGGRELSGTPLVPDVVGTLPLGLGRFLIGRGKAPSDESRRRCDHAEACVASVADRGGAMRGTRQRGLSGGTRVALTVVLVVLLAVVLAVVVAPWAPERAEAAAALFSSAAAG